MGNTNLRYFIKQLQQAYYGGSWLDEDVEKKLKAVTEETAFVKPYNYVHSIAEVTSHLIEWRKEIIERFASGRPQQLTVDSPNNWLANELLRSNGWAYLKEQLHKTQNDLVALLETKDDTFLESRWSGEDTYKWLLSGLIEHDVYHLGQIGLIFKMINHQRHAL